MCIICRKEYTNETTVIDCSWCTNLTSIPQLDKLTRLNCNCTKITSLPLLKNLTYLDCSNCVNLTSLALRPEGSSIPILENLTKLYCYNCIRLTSLFQPSSQELRSKDSISLLKNLTYLNCYGCIKLTSALWA